ncbi:Hint domain-containing protein [Litoreibacter janthinus]|uniref:Hint domain-containing protein n=1 Tax=Litoreibacter janthinus TaxID=670154 RepID=A0A1I6HU27_9RHOB|nr:Hint domain-containing protein [Litoreibacter janthinus]SFR57934.1 Hint domain-containing protein [Litoreibacter janthinus]
MKTGFQGTYVLTSDQIQLDGTVSAPDQLPQTGQVWSWHGDAVRLDGTHSPLILTDAIGHDDMRRRVARVVQRKFDLPEHGEVRVGEDDQIGPDGFVLSDGEVQFTLVPIRSPRLATVLWWCADGVPLAGRDYRVTSVPGASTVQHRSTDFGGDVICFTKGTRIRTPDGDTPVEQLSLGDVVQTKDDGPQEILWIGQRRMSGARLYAMPELRPVRLRAAALDQDVPDEDLLVSPHHRILFSGPNAQALFNQSEVLVAASDLINDNTVFVDHAVKEVTYIHLLLSRHQVLWANGVATESYHPANTTLKTVDASQRSGLLELFPELKRDLHSYGPFARRNLDRSEAAILMHDIV